MKKYPYRKIHAFTREGSEGNPAAYLNLGADLLTPEQMLKIAQEHRSFVSEFMFLNETASGAGTDRKIPNYKLTYYSSEGEIAFCGHGTIATMMDVIRENPELRDVAEFDIDTSMKGRLTVYNNAAAEDSVFISSPDPIFHECPVNAAEVADALEVPLASISGEHPLGLIDAGLRTLIVPVAGFDTEVSLFPDRERLERFAVANDFDVFLIFTLETADPACFAHSRVFAPRFGYLEDPATGSANSAFGRYLLANKLWNGELIAIEQGGNDRVFNEVRLQTRGEKLLFGGRSTKVIEGLYFL